MKEFIEIYCKDIMKDKEIAISLFNNYSDFPYDYIGLGPDNKETKMLKTNGKEDIPLYDVISMDEEDFSKVYPFREAVDTYRKYMSNYTIRIGEEALNEIKAELEKEKKRLEAFKDMNLNDMKLW